MNNNSLQNTGHGGHVVKEPAVWCDPWPGHVLRLSEIIKHTFKNTTCQWSFPC